MIKTAQVRSGTIFTGIAICAICAVAGVARSQAAQASEFTIDPSHSRVEFGITHLVGKVKGVFKDFGGDFHFRQED